MTCIYKLPAPLGVSAGCFGKSFKVKIGALEGNATFPTLEWSGESEPHITIPDIQPDIKRQAEHRIDASNKGWDKWHFWGSVSSYNPKKHTIIRANVSAILLEFTITPGVVTYSDYLHGRGHPIGEVVDTLFPDVDIWFDGVRTWVEAAVDQDADPENPINTAKVPGQGLMVFTTEEGVVSLPASASKIIVNMVEYDSVKLPILRKIVKQANAGVLPGDAHLLLKDSRAEFRRYHYRRAVIDAGSATELALADFNRLVTHVSPASGRPPTLGWYVRRIGTAAGLPPNTMTDLVTLRNGAIHQNRTPSHSEAALALDLARQIVNQLEPLAL